jgi:hypothetical protein
MAMARAFPWHLAFAFGFVLLYDTWSLAFAICSFLLVFGF